MKQGVETLCCFLWFSKRQPEEESMEAELKGTSDRDCIPHLARVQEKLY